jgi:transposase
MVGRCADLNDVCKVERLFAWLYNFRRLVVRYEYHVENYVGLVQLACVVILLRHL